MIKTIPLLSICAFQFTFSQNKLNGFVGVNYSYFSTGFASGIQAEQSFGINIGASYEIPLNDKIAFRPGLAYIQIGDRTESGPSDLSHILKDINLPLSYIVVPMDFKFWNKIYLVAGPQLGFLVTQKNAEQLGDFGVNLGTGFTVNRMFFEVGLYQGLIPIYEDVIPTGANLYSGYAKFIVGYRIL